MSKLSTKWENTDGCAEQYRCASEIYLMSVMSQCYSVIIDRGISAPGHGKYVFDGLNIIDKRGIYQLLLPISLHDALPISVLYAEEFHIPHVKIMGTNHRGESFRTAFKRRK